MTHRLQPCLELKLHTEPIRIKLCPGNEQQNIYQQSFQFYILRPSAIYKQEVAIENMQVVSTLSCGIYVSKRSERE
jgi:hypothetical protein